MKRLYVLRHLKSDWEDETLDDHDRPLSKRGLRDGSALGAYCARAGIAPDLVLSSTALRTRETLAFVLPYLPKLPQLQLLGGLYLASADDILTQARQYGGQAERILIIGHNDGLHQFAARIYNTGPRQSGESLAAKYPTGAFSSFDIPLNRWQDLGWRSGDLQDYWTPKSERTEA
ncbi:SixA phosphatase family protein [Lacibacterium aquatile]|uniref:SixA phosphatase family protein n=1 Tax=Lacibacterium aquatile TaxID=1168082 RepID=A0ABW5DPZ9_9PROT